MRQTPDGRRQPPPRLRTADLLVLGSRDYGPIARVLLGSASGPIVAHAPCPVLVVARP